MKFPFSSLAILQLLPCTLEHLYYPPILSPKKGDIIAIGSNFTVIWNSTLPTNLTPEQIANSTEVRLGFYFPPEPPQHPDPAAYFEWRLENLNPTPNPIPGRAQNLDFYVPTKPYYKSSGFGWGEFNIDAYFCARATDLVVGWFDATDPQEMSEPFQVVGDCWTG